jgi:hypothetical protein
MPADKIHASETPATVPETEVVDVESTLFGSTFRVTSDDRNSLRIVEGRVSISTNPTSKHETVLQSLRDSDRLSVRKLFHNLAPPRMEALAGEYDAELLNQGGQLYDVLTEFAFGIHGSWLGKAFHPKTASAGVGYNCFQSNGTIVRKLPMETTIDTSELDDSPSLKIRYRAKNRGLITRLCGEIRQVTPRILLGIGIFDPTLNRNHALCRQIPFILVGPRRPFQHGCESQKTDQHDRSISRNRTLRNLSSFGCLASVRARRLFSTQP